MGIPQISPTSTAVGLTSHGIGAAPGEPEKYYPTGIRTYARVVPSDAIEAAAQVRLQQEAGCGKTYILDDGEFDGDDAEASFQVAARAAHLKLAGVQTFDPRVKDYRPLATAVAKTGADCVLISAITEDNAVLLTKQVAQAMPNAKLFGTARSGREHVCRSRAGRHSALAGPAGADHRRGAGPFRVSALRPVVL